MSLASGHRSTIIFANNRRTVEKLTARLNEDVEATRRGRRGARRIVRPAFAPITAA